MFMTITPDGWSQITLRSVLAMELFDDLLDDETLIRRPQTFFF